MAGLKQFNIRDERGRLLCPACGYDGGLQIPQYDDDRGLRISICEACLWEPGFDDGAASTPDDVTVCLRAYRQSWSGVPPWLGSGSRPTDWSGERQLAHLFVVAPHVR